VPVAAGLILVVGIGFLLLRPGGSSEVADEVRTTRARDDDPPPSDASDPTTPSTQASVPVQTPPPLIEPPLTTVPVPDTTQATTVPAPVSAGPTADEARAALVTLDDLTNPEWLPDTLDESGDDPCGTTPEEALATVNESVIFARTSTSPVAVRQVLNTIISFPDVAVATQAFDNDIQLLRNCNNTSVDIGGVIYDVSIEISKLNESQTETLPCADDNSLIIAEFTNTDATVPYLGLSAASFRCGLNITVVSFASTVDIDDLSDDDYFAATAASNLRVAELAGSS
jgi:hypothetical protein